MFWDFIAAPHETKELNGSRESVEKIKMGWQAICFCPEAQINNGKNMELPSKAPRTEKVSPLTERQAALMALIQGLDPEVRHTLTVLCRGAEPWKVEKIVEHRDIELRPSSEKK